MDGSQFDALSRALVANHSRRVLTRVLAGIALGGAFTVPALREAAAKRK
jgi:hypothetical protein